MTKPATHDHTTKPPRLATVYRAAEEIDGDHTTIRKMVNEGQLTRYSYGPRFLRVDLDELYELLRTGKPQAKPLDDPRESLPG